jgi:AraC-like DNA-binding protein
VAAPRPDSQHLRHGAPATSVYTEECDAVPSPASALWPAGATGSGSRAPRPSASTGTKQWRAQLRLHYSLALLAGGLSVTATAIRCGYSTPSAFTAAFRATFGTTPAAYRQDLAA